MKALTGFGLVSGAASGAAVMLAWDRGADAWTLARLAIGAAALSLSLGWWLLRELRRGE
jgi:hypothetical protein